MVVKQDTDGNTCKHGCKIKEINRNAILFPQLLPEIIENTSESHFALHSRPFRVIYAGILVAIIAVLGFIPFIWVDVTTQSRGIIRSAEESNIIQTSLYGQVLISFLKEGLKVLNGDTLLILRTDKLNEQIQLKGKQYRDNYLFITDLKLLTDENNKLIKTPKFRLEWMQYEAKIEELKVKIRLLKKEYELAEHLYHEKVTPEIEYLQKKNQFEFASSQLSFFKQQARNNWQAEQTRLQLENKEIESTIRQLKEEISQYVLTAPVDGILMQVAGIQAGSFVNPGQNLAQISPQDNLLAECFISPSDIGYIRINQPVRIQLDAFNYNQWGLLHGEVTRISDDIIALNNQPVFKVRCQLNQKYLELKSGQRGYLKKGMTLTGRFVLTRRNLYQLFFDKMDDWLNPKIKGTRESK